MEYTIHKIRWLLLGMISAAAFTLSYMDVCFGSITYEGKLRERIRIDSTRGSSPVEDLAAAGICLILAFAAKAFGVRLQSVAVAIFAFCAACISMFGIVRGRFEWINPFGQIIVGMGHAILYIVAVNTANSWFPPDQVATAFSLPISFYWLGATVAMLLSVEAISAPEEVTDAKPLADTTSKIVLSCGVILLALSFILTVFLCIHSRDGSPTSPSRADEKIREAEGDLEQDVPNLRKFKSHLAGMLKILISKAFICLTAANFFGAASVELAVFLLPDALRKAFGKIKPQTTGYVLILATVSAALGGVLAGRMLDKFGKFKQLSLAGAALMVITCGGIHLGHYLNSLPALFVVYPLLELFRAFAFIACVEFLVEATYPSNKTTLASLHFFIYFFGRFVFGASEKLTLRLGGVQFAVLIAVLGSFLSFVTILPVAQEYRRSEVNMADDEEKDDTTTASETEHLLTDG